MQMTNIPRGKNQRNSTFNNNLKNKIKLLGITLIKQDLENKNFKTSKKEIEKRYHKIKSSPMFMNR